MRLPGGGDPQTYAIIGTAMEMRRAPGCGFFETVYQEALAFEFEKQGIPSARAQPEYLLQGHSAQHAVPCGFYLL